MKSLIVTILVLSSFSSFADVLRPAKLSEVKAFCAAYDAELSRIEADAALNKAKCAKSKKFKVSSIFVYGKGYVTQISGPMPLRDSNRSFDLDTTATILKDGSIDFEM